MFSLDRYHELQRDYKNAINNSLAVKADPESTDEEFQVAMQREDDAYYRLEEYDERMRDTL